jgi:NAD(P)-dependent dehydrogenase (short-subunit alcohol dehydrogenase family)
VELCSLALSEGCEEILIMKLPFNIDLSGKVAVVTVGGGVLCGTFAKAIAACGAKVAILDLRKEAADKVADEIVADGGVAISNFTQWLAVHFSKVGIRVNAIAPGFFVTDQNRALLFNDKGEYTDRSKKIISQTPMERFGEKEELIGALLFLLSKDAASFVNGIVIPVDGGFSAYSGV